MMLENLWLFKRAFLRSLSKSPTRNALIRTTVACTMAQAGSAPNVLPDTARVVCNCRPAHGETCEDILRFVRALTHGLDIEVEAQVARDASNISDFAGLPFQTLRSVIRETFGEIPVVPGIMSGGTDARKYEPLSASVFRFMPFVLTPFDSAKMHACNESVRIESMGRAVEFYKRLIGAMAGWERRDG
jgi:carboxypeptidase PM20D1